MAFYPFMMQYLWDLKTVMDLANLEIAIFQRFPNKEDMEKYIEALEYDILDTFKDEDDEASTDFKKTFETLKSNIFDFENPGYDIYKVDEAVSVEDILKESDKESDKAEKDTTLHVGRIVQR